MNSIYDFEDNVKVMTTINGDKVITMNREILVTIENALYDAIELQEKQGHIFTAKGTQRIIKALNK